MTNKTLETHHAVHVGRCLGLYDVLVETGAITSEELATQTGLHKRYVDYWLDQQIDEGLIEINQTSTRTPLFRVTPGLAGLIEREGHFAESHRRLW